MSYRDIAKASIQKSEGCKLRLYKDSEGYWTIAWGRLLDPERGGISQAEADFMLENDLKQDETTARAFFPTFDSLSDNRKAVLIDMAHCLRNRLNGFVKFRAAVAAGDFIQAETEMMQSRWATQVGNRAVRLGSMMRNG